MAVDMMTRAIFFFSFIFVTPALLGFTSPQVDASRALVERIVPSHADYFVVESFASASLHDVFEIESRKGKVVLRGNNGVAIASALYHYLREYVHCQVTWNGTNLHLPKVLPPVPVKVRKETSYQYRYYLNYCTFNYSMSWWDWARWEKEIDWMALHGINMPLALTGQEYVWYHVYKELGFSDDDLASFFPGPAYFAWFWMGNLDGWGGPLPKSWMKRQKELQEKILRRQRELGMTPVLPAFTGHVPAAFTKRFPHAKLKQTNWTNGFADTYILDPEDPMFEEIGRKFLHMQTKLFGTDHLYSADTFNENEPPSDDPAYLATLSKKVYEGMKSADMDATWVMQGWLFYSDREFWKAPQIKALLDAVPDDRMIILDLAAEIEPVWKRTHAFYGKPWIWNMLHNFGGNISMFGRMETVANEPPAALADSSSRMLKGVGLTMEGIEQNPVLYELMTDHIWRNEPINLDEWLPDYILNRYGTKDKHALKAWDVLRNTVYNGKDIRDGAESILVARPTLEPARRWAKTRLNYPAPDLLPAWDALLKVAPSCHSFPGFKYDLVDVTRQVLANYAMALHGNAVAAYREKNAATLNMYSNDFIALLDDIDRLLGTQEDFLLGKWIHQARMCGETSIEKALYERNARDLITLWGGKDNRLHEYSCRQWNGLIRDFYKPRWKQFFELLQESLRAGTPFNADDFEYTMQDWEWNWVNSQKEFETLPQGDPVDVAKQLYSKYKKTIEETYKPK
jgi:alpha-N-acetylglucosaminidase